MTKFRNVVKPGKPAIENVYWMNRVDKDDPYTNLSDK